VNKLPLIFIKEFYIFYKNYKNQKPLKMK
ncbi:glucosamine--fructose-6-phosphate aminotransferase, partial [Haemophilus influenzae]